MFGHQVLKIPLHGKLVKHIPLRRPQSKEILRESNNSPKSLGEPIQFFSSSQNEKKPISSAMMLLRGYYGLSPTIQSPSATEGMELTSCHSDAEEHFEDEPLSPMTPPSKSKNEKDFGQNGGTPISRLSHEFSPEPTLVSGFGKACMERSSEPSVRRRSKTDGMSPLLNGSETDMKLNTDFMQETSSPGLSNGTDSLGIKTIGLLKALDGALISGKMKDDSMCRVKKSMSTSNLQDQTSVQVSSLNPKYGAKAEIKSGNFVQPTSRSLFEGFPKPALPRYKEALD
ncbi:hypothetical protein KP509_29G069100 [Ceratopteris richardii]|nr:hypothetical protein KP509_29G069100 [Ceratopteris richardii]